METYALEKTGLELAGGRLLKKDKKGAVEAAFDVRKIRGAAVITAWDPVGVGITTGVLALTLVFYFYIPQGMWRWVAVIVSTVIFLMCTLGAKGRTIVVEIGDDRIEYPALELPDQIASFVAMINQARGGEAEEEPTGELR